MITLTRNDDDTFTEQEGQDNFLWVRTSYTEPRESLDDCTVCGEPIEEWDMFLCMDNGSEQAHIKCVVVK